MQSSEHCGRPRPRFKTIRSIRAQLSQDLSDREVLHIKESAYRQALLNGWFATALEQTKSVFTLASAAVGLTLTLIFTSEPHSPYPWNHVWLVLASVAFAITSGLCIAVFRLNRDLVSSLARDEDVNVQSGLIRRVDLTARLLFTLALVFLVFAAMAQVWLA